MAQTQSRLLDLPVELRTAIYRDLLVPEIVLLSNFECRIRPWHPPLPSARQAPQLETSILTVCKQIHDEATGILYDDNTFAFILSEDSCLGTILHGQMIRNTIFTTLRYMNVKKGSMRNALRRMRCIEISIDFSDLWSTDVGLSTRPGDVPDMSAFGFGFDLDPREDFTKRLVLDVLVALGRGPGSEMPVREKFEEHKKLIINLGRLGSCLTSSSLPDGSWESVASQPDPDKGSTCAKKLRQRCIRSCRKEACRNSPRLGSLLMDVTKYRTLEVYKKNWRTGDGFSYLGRESITEDFIGMVKRSLESEQSFIRHKYEKGLKA